MKSVNKKIGLYIQDIVDETADTVTIKCAQSNPKLDYLPGQFLTVIAEINGKEYRRAYSLCTSPYADDYLAVTIKKVKGGKMSNYLCENLKAGDKLLVLPPMGNFKFKPGGDQRHIMLIGGGSGITPLFSIIKSALIEEPTSMVSLIYVNSNRKNTIYYRELEQWSSQFSPRFRIEHYWSDVMKSEQPKRNFWLRLFKKAEASAHRINSLRLKAILNGFGIENSTNPEFYICGPQQLMEMAKTTIQEMGFPKRLVFSEDFYNPIKTKRTEIEVPQRHQIKIRLKGKEHEVTVPAGKSILFSALDLGIDLSYSCQSGNCVSCAGKCLSGNVEMSTSEGLTKEQKEDGYVLTCVGYPKSDDVVIEFN
jgi:ring-1,2-phenylacetyl-CoA epoxidase subunit PaaE